MTSIVKHHPRSLMRDIQNELNQLFNYNWISRQDSADIATSQWRPRVDIKEAPEGFVIVADLPGVDPKEIEISMENNALTIKGERKLEHRIEGKNDVRIERSFGAFYRRFVLPDNAEGDTIQAKSKHGVLELFIPKKQMESTKKIAVQVEGA